MRKTITFDYIDKSKCNLKTDKKSWGCCCICEHRYQVNAHCWHSPGNIHKPIKKSHCVCSESLGFYVCAPLGEWGRRVNLNGKHGVCELYEKLIKP